MKIFKKNSVMVFIFILAYASFFSILEARYGGGGGGVGGGGGGGGVHSSGRGNSEFTIIFNFFLLCFFVVMLYVDNRDWFRYIGYRYIFIINHDSKVDLCEPWEDIESMLKDRFIECQELWMDGDISPLKKLTTKYHFNQIKSLLKKDREKGIQNILEDIKISKIKMVRMSPNKDEFTAKIFGKMRDYKVDELSQKLIDKKQIKSKRSFSEYWTMQFDDKNKQWIIVSVGEKLPTFSY